VRPLEIERSSLLSEREPSTRASLVCASPPVVLDDRVKHLVEILTVAKEGLAQDAFLYCAILSRAALPRPFCTAARASSR